VAKLVGRWPHGGRPIRACAACHGTGLRPGAASRRALSRDPTETRLDAVRCVVCQGRGSVLVTPEVAR